MFRVQGKTFMTLMKELELSKAFPWMISWKNQLKGEVEVKVTPCLLQKWKINFSSQRKDFHDSLVSIGIVVGFPLDKNLKGLIEYERLK